MSGAVDLSSAEQVGRLLGPYLNQKLATPVRFADGPTAVTGGWETYIFTFRLAAAEGGPPQGKPPELLDRDLILRVYQGDNALAKGETESLAQTLLADAGYPAPRPLLFEPDATLLGQPFMIMEKLPGRTMLEVMSSSGPLTALKMMTLLGSCHARLHALDLTHADVPERAGPSPLEGAMLGARLLVEADGVQALIPLLAWLEQRKDALPQEGASVLHLDFHPLNVMVHDGEVSGVIDWPSVTVGDAHFDVATTVTLLATAPIGENIPPWARLLLPTVRRLLIRRYLAGYARQRPLDRKRLRFCEVGAALRWLVVSQLFRYIRPQTIGVKAESAAFVSQREIDALCRFIGKRTGLAINISLAEIGRPSSG